MINYEFKNLIISVTDLIHSSDDRSRNSFRKRYKSAFKELDLVKSERDLEAVIMKLAKATYAVVSKKKFHARALFELYYFIEKKELKKSWHDEGSIHRMQLNFYLYITLFTYPHLFFHTEDINSHGFGLFYPFRESDLEKIESDEILRFRTIRVIYFLYRFLYDSHQWRVPIKGIEEKFDFNFVDEAQSRIRDCFNCMGSDEIYNSSELRSIDIYQAKNHKQPFLFSKNLMSIMDMICNDLVNLLGVSDEIYQCKLCNRHFLFVANKLETEYCGHQNCRQRKKLRCY